MNVSPSKENILKKIRKALTHSTPLPFPQSDGSHTGFPRRSRNLKLNLQNSSQNCREIHFLFESPGTGVSI
jgi:hypothetical protein